MMMIIMRAGYYIRAHPPHPSDFRFSIFDMLLYMIYSLYQYGVLAKAFLFRKARSTVFCGLYPRIQATT